MTVEVNDSRKPYPGNGVGTIFTGPRLFNEATLTVSLVDDATGALLDPGTYTVTNVGNAQSTVTMDVPPPVGTTLVLVREIPVEQSTDFTNQQTLLRRVVEATFDLLVMMIQQIADAVQRSVRLPVTSSGVDPVLPTPAAGMPIIWNGTGTGLVNGDSAIVGDMLLRPNLAAFGSGAGSDLVAFPGSAPAYLQTVSDVLNGSEVSLLRFIPRAQHAAILAGTSVYDCGDDLRAMMLDTDVRAVVIPAGRFNYSGNLTRGATGLALRGVSSRHSILRCVGAGGIVFNGGAVTDAFTFPVLDLADLRILATIPNAGTAVTMNYTGGSGIPALGPRWHGVAIEAEAHGAAFNIGVRGTNVRDFRIESMTVAGSNGNPGYPANYLMDHGFLMDGNDDPVELWIRDYYGYYLKQGFEVGGQYEGIYVDHAHTVAMWHFLKWDSATPNPVVMVSDSYIASERSGVDLNRVSYFRLQDSVYNPTAPTPDANYEGIIIRRTVGDQTQASDISGNSFVGVGYSSRIPPFTETAIHLVNANTVAVNNNTVYDMDVGVKGTAGSGNRIGPNNRYINVTTPEQVPIAMRSGHLSPECVFKASKQGGTQVVPINTLTQITFDTTERDDRSYYVAGTGAFTPPAGHYRVRGRLRISDAVVGDFLGVYITVGGAAVHLNGTQAASSGLHVIEVNGTVEVNGLQAIAIAINVETGVGGATRTVFPQNVATRFEVESIVG